MVQLRTYCLEEPWPWWRLQSRNQAYSCGFATTTTTIHGRTLSISTDRSCTNTSATADCSRPTHLIKHKTSWWPWQRRSSPSNTTHSGGIFELGYSPWSRTDCATSGTRASIKNGVVEIITKKDWYPYGLIHIFQKFPGLKKARFLYPNGRKHLKTAGFMPYFQGQASKVALKSYNS